MENLIISQTGKTPAVEFSTDGRLKISGRGMSTDPRIFYNPALEWVDNYLKEPPPQTEISIALEYVQSGDIRMIMEILKKFSHRADLSHKVIINWFYESGDEDQKDLGDSISQSMRIPFNLIEVG